MMRRACAIYWPRMAVDPKTSVHVGNLPPYPLCEIEELLFELFLQIGPVVKVFVPYCKENGSHKGYAFVEFLHEESVPYSCKMMHGIKLLGLYIGVNPAVSKVEKELANGVMEEGEGRGEDRMVTPNTAAVERSPIEDQSNVTPQKLFGQSNMIMPPPHPPTGLFCPPFPPPPFPSFPMHPPPPSLTTPPLVPPLPPLPPHFQFTFNPQTVNMAPPTIPSMVPPNADMGPINDSVTPPSISLAPPILNMAPPNSMDMAPFSDVSTLRNGMSLPTLSPIEPPTFSSMPAHVPQVGGANGSLATAQPKSINSILTMFDDNPFKIAAKILAESKNCNQRLPNGLNNIEHEAEYRQPLNSNSPVMGGASLSIDGLDSVINPTDDISVDGCFPGNDVINLDDEYCFSNDLSNNCIEVFDYNHQSAMCSTSPAPS